MAQDTYDVIVLGAGSTGENVAGRVADAGLSAVLVEDALVGGDCSYWACIPSKALLRPPQARRAATVVDGARQAVTGQLDVEAVLARRTAFTSGWDDAGQARWVSDAGIELLRGRARLAGDKRVEVDVPGGGTRRLTARHAVAICTGSDPAIPPVPGLADLKPWTTADATSATEIPARVVVLGGGVAGCELAQAMQALGAEEVTICQRATRLLPRFEPFVGDYLAAAFAEAGITVRTSTTVTSAEPGGGGTAVLTVDGENGETRLTADRVLVAAGRTPATTGVGLETVGLEPGRWLDVDETLRVRGVDDGWLYAVGDVNGRALLTHMGKYQARACGDVIVARARGEEPAQTGWSRYVPSADIGAVPQVVFTDPEVAAVGLTEQQARDSGLSVRTVEHPIGSLAGAALYEDGYTGQAKLVVDEQRRVVVGATFVGPAVGELLHAATIAVVGQVPLDTLWHAVPSFPTISEVWLRLLETYGL